jgi:ppGpp synthetase/RelA/SpoT-type nucleotidyltranferase
VASEAVVEALRRRGVLPTGRRAKSTVSIVEKLRRESTKLSRMQDIAGCRVIIGGVLEQDRFVESLKADFPVAKLVDRRDSPSHGYRAVHVIVKTHGKLIEVQVRTSLQHLWAEVSERSADLLDPAIKYGGGPQWWQDILENVSRRVADLEKAEKVLADPTSGVGDLAKTCAALRRKIAQKRKEGRPKLQEYKEELQHLTNLLKRGKQVDKELRNKAARSRKEIDDWLAKANSVLEQLKGRNQ